MTMLAETKNGNGLLTLTDYEARIHLYKEQIGYGYIGIGRTLNEAKDAKVVPHGAWETWVTNTTGLNIQQAQRCMRAAREIKDGSALAQLEMSKALMLLSSGLDAETREKLAAKASEENETVKQLRAEIDQAQEEIRRAHAQASQAARDAEQARTDAKKATAVAETYRGSAVHWRQQSEYQARQIEEMRQAVPPTVIQEPADYEKLKRMAARHQAEMEEAAQAAEEAEKRAAAAEAELSRMRMRQGEAERDRYTEIQNAANAFLISARMLPYDGVELANAENRKRYALMMKPIREWVLEMQRALEYGALEAEGGVR